MGDLLKAFGVTIAFIVPGVLMLLIGAYAFDRALEGLKFLGSSEMASVGPVILLVISIALGLVVHATAWFVYEMGMVQLWYGLAGETRPSVDMEKAFGSEAGQKAFDYINEQTYRYHQFFGGLSIVAFTLSFVLVEVKPLPGRLAFWSFLLGVLLGFAAIRMLLNNHSNLGRIFPPRQARKPLDSFRRISHIPRSPTDAGRKRHARMGLKRRKIRVPPTP
ncbi:MAG: hypothetical protein AAF950_13005 [Pseudomonadota bacterium]